MRWVLMWGLWTHSRGTCCLLKEVDFKLWGGPVVDLRGESILEVGAKGWENSLARWRMGLGQGYGGDQWGNEADRKHKVQTVKVLKNSLRTVKVR